LKAYERLVPVNMQGKLTLLNVSRQFKNLRIDNILGRVERSACFVVQSSGKHWIVAHYCRHASYDEVIL
jgi:hypothetical protein